MTMLIGFIISHILGLLRRYFLAHGVSITTFSIMTRDDDIIISSGVLRFAA